MTSTNDAGVPNDRISLLRDGEGREFHYVPPALVRQRLEEENGHLVGSVHELRLLIAHLQEENAALRAELAQAGTKNKARTAAHLNVDDDDEDYEE